MYLPNILHGEILLAQENSCENKQLNIKKNEDKCDRVISSAS